MQAPSLPRLGGAEIDTPDPYALRAAPSTRVIHPAMRLDEASWAAWGRLPDVPVER
jgi:hypothetical protein